MTNRLPYAINDADNHFNEPPDLYEQFIDPSKMDLAIRYVQAVDGTKLQLFAGKPSRFTASQVVYSKEELAKMLGDTSSLGVVHEEGVVRARPPRAGELTTIPGMLLNRLNPLKGLSEDDRRALVAEFRNKAEAFGNRDLRLALMDEQGIDKALMFPGTAMHIEDELSEDLEAQYANIRAYNRWLYEEIGYTPQNRMFLPPYLSLADTELAVKELDVLLETGARMLLLKSGHAHGGRDNPWGGRSPADPVFDPLWERVNEARMRVTVHLGATDYHKYGRDWSEDPDVTFGDFDAFQWMMYWGDRPAFELTAGLILHNFFGRFPNIRVCLSEMGTVWLPYCLRKMDHAFLLGRKAKWAENGRLDRRPSQIFREHFVVAPYPEENVKRVVAEVGIEPIVFGSDFPHGEGLAYPWKYVDAQLSGFSDAEQEQIMRGNLEAFLAGAAAG